MTARVTAVILAYGAEAWLEEAVGAVLASTDVEIDIVVVDNGCTSGAIDRVKGLTGVRVITPETNTGFSGGCVRGAAEATGDYLAFVNSDAIVAARCACAVGRRRRRTRGGVRDGLHPPRRCARTDQHRGQPAALRRAVLGRRPGRASLTACGAPQGHDRDLAAAS